MVETAQAIARLTLTNHARRLKDARDGRTTNDKIHNRSDHRYRDRITDGSAAVAADRCFERYVEGDELNVDKKSGQDNAGKYR